MTTLSGITALRMMTTIPSWIMKPPAGQGWAGWPGGVGQGGVGWQAGRGWGAPGRVGQGAVRWSGMQVQRHEVGKYPGLSSRMAAHVHACQGEIPCGSLERSCQARGRARRHGGARPRRGGSKARQQAQHSLSSDRSASFTPLLLIIWRVFGVRGGGGMVA